VEIELKCSLDESKISITNPATKEISLVNFEQSITATYHIFSIVSRP